VTGPGDRGGGPRSGAAPALGKALVRVEGTSREREAVARERRLLAARRALQLAAEESGRNAVT
jgi:hypothetical protein